MRRSVLGLVTMVVGAGIALAGCQIDQGNGGSGGGGPSLPPPSVITKQWRMPDLVGTGLQQAQDDIQRLTHNGIFFTSSHDVTGRGRHQVIDSDWQVCTQSVPAGAAITIRSKIDFGVVRVSEKCP